MCSQIAVKCSWTEIGLDEVGFIRPIPLDCLSDVTLRRKSSIISNITYSKMMSVERKNPLKRDQALNDATSGQMEKNQGLNHHLHHHQNRLPT
jgi:hypothetical protein